MEGNNDAKATILLCEACFAKINDADHFCNNCGYPLKASKFEQNKFIYNRTSAEVDMVAFKKRLQRAGNTLYYLAVIFIVAGVFSFFSLKDDPLVLAIVIPYIILGVLFLVLGDLSKKRPVACMICGLCLYVIAQLLIIISDPYAIDIYIIIKFVIIGYLAMGIKSAIEIERIKKEHNIA